MSRSIRIEGLAGGSRGAGGIAGRARSNSASAAKVTSKTKKSTTPKSAVTVTKPFSKFVNRTLNTLENTNVSSRKSEAAKELARQEKMQVIRRNAGGRMQTVKINTNPTKTKGIFGPLKKQLDISSGAAKGRSVANAKALRGLKPLKNKKK